MTLQELIQANPDGFTLDTSTKQLANKTTGYFVSLTNCVYKQDDDLKGFLKAHHLFNSNCNREVYIGGWKDSDDYYLDFTIWIEDCYQALLLAKIFDQKAVWDCKNKQGLNI